MKLYLDIETTGLWPGPDAVTVVGALKGDSFIQLVAGQNLTQTALDALVSDVTQVIGFNSRRFDVPFLEKAFPTLCFPKNHRDLMFDGWSCGLKGGLKSLEQQLGLARADPQANGRLAVTLWKQHLDGDATALQRLLAYNREDVLNLPLLESILEKRYAQLYPARFARATQMRK